MTFSRKNYNKKKPSWFLKVKKAITLLSDAATIILLGIGYAENSLLILILRVGISAVLESVQLLISDETNE
ncbi:hypothetical protein [Flavobacterium koreense]